MVRLEKVTYKNEEDVIRLDLFESQYSFVADNVESLADAYIAITSDKSEFFQEIENMYMMEALC